MTNEELYKDEVEKIMKEDDTRHPAVRNGKPVSCIGLDCCDCDLHKPNSGAGCSAYYRDWLKSEAEPSRKGEMMTNGEKYKGVIKRMTRRYPPYPPLHPAVVNGKVVPCTGLNCNYCDLSTPPYHGGCNDNYEKWFKSEAESEKSEPEKPKQERMVTRTVSNAKGEEVVYYNILYGFGRQDVLEKLYHYEQEEEEEKMEKDKIKVGDTVKVTADPLLKGKTGIVRRIYCSKNGKLYVVRFDGGDFCWSFSDHEIVKVRSKKTPPCIVAYRDGDTVTVKDLETGETASAVCSKKDTFDIHTGAFIAMSRLTHFDTDIRLMRLEWEQIESYVSDIKMRFGALMGKGYKYPDFDEEEKAK